MKQTIGPNHVRAGTTKLSRALGGEAHYAECVVLKDQPESVCICILYLLATNRREKHYTSHPEKRNGPMSQRLSAVFEHTPSHPDGRSHPAYRESSQKIMLAFLRRGAVVD